MRIPEIVKMPGMPSRSPANAIRNWIRVGLITPTAKLSGKGSGRGCGWDIDQSEIPKIREIAKMAKMRIPIREVRDLIKMFSADQVAKLCRKNEARMAGEHRRMVTRLSKVKGKEVPRLRGQEFAEEEAVVRALLRVDVRLRRARIGCGFSEQNRAIIHDVLFELVAIFIKEVQDVSAKK